MAVFTPLEPDDVSPVLAAYGVGPLLALHGVAGGSVNSNFAVDLSGGGRLFLRLYEEQDTLGAARETAMLQRLEREGVPTPAPLRRLDGGLVTVLRGKPAALFPWRQGVMRCQASVTPDDARRVGEALARFHVASVKESADRGRFRFEDLDARLDAIATSRHPTFAPRVASLRQSLQRAHARRREGLPEGVIHGDLFRDNVLWAEDGSIAALLDFESAFKGAYAYDLMVTVLAWCFGDDFDLGLASAMRGGYEAVRPLTEAEASSLPDEGAFAALRFTITRITDYAMREGASGTRVIKDWRRFLHRFERVQSLGTRLWGV